jgi:hypothetical protein
MADSYQSTVALGLNEGDIVVDQANRLNDADRKIDSLH